jgi:hypothetical protein
VITSPGHSGSYAAQLGSSSAFNGDSTLTQTVTMPSGASTLSFWYSPHCAGALASDQIQMQIRKTSGQRLATVLNVCSNTGAWALQTYSVPRKIAGRTGCCGSTSTTTATRPLRRMPCSTTSR